MLNEEDLRRERVYFPDHKFGQGVFVCNPGIVINPSMVGTKAPKGMHGYLPNHPSTDAVLLTTKKICEKTNHISDLFKLIKSII